MTTVNRDPFARLDLVRRTVIAPGGCSWCGNPRYKGGKPTNRLFSYGTYPDGIRSRVAWHAGVFCSKSCHDSYHS